MPLRVMVGLQLQKDPLWGLAGAGLFWHPHSGSKVCPGNLGVMSISEGVHEAKNGPKRTLSQEQGYAHWMPTNQRRGAYFSLRRVHGGRMIAWSQFHPSGIPLCHDLVHEIEILLWGIQLDRDLVQRDRDTTFGPAMFWYNGGRDTAFGPTAPACFGSRGVAVPL